MGISIQTNVNSMIAQDNMRVNSDLQGRTIQRLTSGFRINSSADDAAGLAVSNKFRSDVTELTQGVRNANDGVSQLQIMDGGLNNISKILDRMKTLATQASSGTFTGSRATLNNEFKTLKAEIDRQATNIGLVSGGQYNAKIGVFIGGGVGQANSSVSFDLSGSANRVDSVSLGISAATGIDQGLKGVGLASNTVATLDASNTTVKYVSGAADAKQTFSVTVGGRTTASIDLNGSADGLTAQQAVEQLNTKLASYGITASIGADATDAATYQKLQFNSSSAFQITAGALSTGAAGAIATATSSATNTGLYNVTSAFTNVSDTATTTHGSQRLTFVVGGSSQTVDLAYGTAIDGAVAAINAKMNEHGVYAIKSGSSISLQSENQFTLSAALNGGTGGTPALDGGLRMNTNWDGASTIASPSTTLNSDPTTQAKLALTAISNAVSNLGAVQGRIGTAQNQLGYAIQLAQSQITNFSAAESRIRDTDVAAEAANLTKAQVLQQASIAAMAQANSAPQAVLSLLRG